MTQQILAAYAKLNLGLRIMGRLADGYHTLITQFQRISLSDSVMLTPRKGDFLYLGPRLTESPAENLVIKAGVAFREAFGGPAMEIALGKRIPVGAGLGGGSSDAAAVLRGMAELRGVDAGDPRLNALASSLGADVPFFVANVPAAIGFGRGDELAHAESLSQRKSIAVIWPGFEISTARAFNELDCILTPPVEIPNFNVRSLTEAERDDGIVNYLNDFELVVFGSNPALRETRDSLLAAGASSAGLAGSGSSLFAIFDSEAKAAAALRDADPSWRCFVCRPC